MSSLDVLLVCPPPSCSDTNPPVGPAILASALRGRQLTVRVCDLGIRYLSQFAGGPHAADATLGDQGKDRRRCHAAREHFASTLPLRGAPALQAPPDADVLMGLHLDFAEVHRLVEWAAQPGSYWHEWLWQHCFRQYVAPPMVLGISVMGPAQLLLGLVVARMARRYWPQTLIVFGGSHITLLAGEIAADTRYGWGVDLFMPGHCEREFTAAVEHQRRGASPYGLPGTLVAGHRCIPGLPPAEFERLPDFTAGSLDGYGAANLVLPLQLTRGCAYALCTFCTYPAVEHFSKPAECVWIEAPGIMQYLMSEHACKRFSFKDSYLAHGWLERLAAEIQHAQLRCEWSACTRLVEQLSPSLLRRLAAAGCRTVEYGLESIHPSLQAVIKKPQDMRMVERVLQDTAAAGIVPVVNLMYGLPGETQAEAEAQLGWFLDARRRLCRGTLRASHYLVEINRLSPMARRPENYGIELHGIAPWAFSYEWNAPAWRLAFQAELNQVACAELSCPALRPAA